MKIAFATAYDARTPPRWTGWTSTGQFLGKSLAAAGAQVHYLGPALAPPLLRGRFKAVAAYAAISGRRHTPLGDPAVLAHYGRVLTRRAAVSGAEVVLCHGMQAATLLETSKPLAMRSDVTVAGILDKYENMSNLLPATRRSVLEAERRAFDRCELLVFSNDWAAAGAKAHYGVPAAKIKVSPPGANLDGPPTKAEVEERVERVADSPVRLLVSGVFWRRKGGEFALEVLRKLQERGVAAHLTLAGMTPPRGTELPDNVEAVGFVDRLTPAGDGAYRRMLAATTILLHPAMADADPGVIREAAAYGVPCISYDLMGLPTVMGDGKTGALLPVEATADDWAAAVVEIVADYRTAAMRAREVFEDRLDWAKNGPRLVALLRGLAGREVA